MGPPPGGIGTVPLRGNLDILHLTRRRRNRQTVLAKALDVKDDCVAYLCFDFSDCGARRNAAGKVWHVCRIVASGLFNDNGVAHKPSPETSLLQDAVQRTGREIVARLAGDRDAADLARVLELPVTAARGCCRSAIDRARAHEESRRPSRWQNSRASFLTLNVTSSSLRWLDKPATARHSTASSPLRSMRSSSFDEGPLGFLSPISHLRTVETLVLSTAARTD